MLLRAKRTYRTIDPVPEVRANRRQRENQPGFTLSNINERVDESVVRYWQERSNPPPNLIEYARRHAARHRSSPMTALAEKAIHHLWMGDSFVPYLGLLLWATVAAAGFLVVDTVFNVWPATPPPWLLAIAAGAFALVDWAESAQNFNVAARGESPPRRAFLDSIYWTRALGVVLFLFGVGGVLYFLATIGARGASLSDALTYAREEVTYWVLISLGAGLGVGLGVVLNHVYARSQSPPARIVIQSAVIGPLISTAVILLATIVVSEVWRLVAPTLDIALPTDNAATTGQQFAGRLLLLQLGLIYFANALFWAGRPMTKAYLGSIVRLQLRVSPQRVKECLDRWCSMLAGPQSHKAGCRMRAVVRETLYRDIIGFIPVYSLVFAFGLWFGAWQLEWAWLQGLWLVVPLTAAAADYIEDICHLRYLKLHERNEPPSRLVTWLGAAMTLVKLVAFIGEAVLTFAIVVVATLRIHGSPEVYGWRGLLALAVSTTVFAIVAGLVAWSALYRLSTRARREHDSVTPSEPQQLALQ
jgi:hypothetical protein